MPQQGPYQNCTSVTPSCPVSATTYGYRPNLAGNAFFLALFILVTLAQGILAIWKRIPAFGIAVTLGCLGEAIGYVGRLMMHNNPWSSVGFKIQIICLIISPSFLAAGIYLTLKHMVMAFGSEKSRLPPKLYTWFFIGADVFSIVVQGAGGGIASAGGSNVNAGDDLMIAGIVFQVVTMLICMLLAVDFGINLLRSDKKGSSSASPGAGVTAGVESGSDSADNVEEKGEESTYRQYASQRRFLYYVICSSVAFVMIFVRCVYRVPELAEGWGSALMRNEDEFLVLDGAMVAGASILLTVAHPGIFFPAIRSKH